MSSFEPSEGAGQVDGGEEISGGLLVACRDGSEMLEDVEKSFDQVALAIEGEITRARDLAIRFRRDDGGDGAQFEGLDQGVRIIPLVGEESFGFDLLDQGVGFLDIVNLAAGQTDRQRVAQRIDNGMDFCREAASRPTYGLVETPFLRAPALCW